MTPIQWRTLNHSKPCFVKLFLQLCSQIIQIECYFAHPLILTTCYTFQQTAELCWMYWWSIGPVLLVIPFWDLCCPAFTCCFWQAVITMQTIPNYICLYHRLTLTALLITELNATIKPSCGCKKKKKKLEHAEITGAQGHKRKVVYSLEIPEVSPSLDSDLYFEINIRNTIKLVISGMLAECSHFQRSAQAGEMRQTYPAGDQAKEQEFRGQAMAGPGPEWLLRPSQSVFPLFQS